VSANKGHFRIDAADLLEGEDEEGTAAAGLDDDGEELWVDGAGADLMNPFRPKFADKT
jgi:hypothetical protein